MTTSNSVAWLQSLSWPLTGQVVSGLSTAGSDWPLTTHIDKYTDTHWHAQWHTLTHSDTHKHTHTHWHTNLTCMVGRVERDKWLFKNWIKNRWRSDYRSWTNPYDHLLSSLLCSPLLPTNIRHSEDSVIDSPSHWMYRIVSYLEATQQLSQCESSGRRKRMDGFMLIHDRRTYW